MLVGEKGLDKEKVYKKRVRHTIKDIEEEMCKMTKITLQKVIFLSFKLIILSLLLMAFLEDYFIVQNSIGGIVLFAYAFVMLICFISLGCAFFFRFRYKRILYIISGVFFIGYCAMNNLVSGIYEARKVSFCLQKGQVYDYNEHRCRIDCRHWSKETGCVKIETK